MPYPTAATGESETVVGRADQNLRQAERREPPGAREPNARNLQYVGVAPSEHSEVRLRWVG